MGTLFKQASLVTMSLFLAPTGTLEGKRPPNFLDALLEQVILSEPWFPHMEAGACLCVVAGFALTPDLCQHCSSVLAGSLSFKEH